MSGARQCCVGSRGLCPQDTLFNGIKLYGGSAATCANDRMHVATCSKLRYSNKSEVSKQSDSETPRDLALDRKFVIFSRCGNGAFNFETLGIVPCSAMELQTVNFRTAHTSLVCFSVSEAHRLDRIDGFTQ